MKIQSPAPYRTMPGNSVTRLYAQVNILLGIFIVVLDALLLDELWPCAASKQA